MHVRRPYLNVYTHTYIYIYTWLQLNLLLTLFHNKHLSMEKLSVTQLCKWVDCIKVHAYRQIDRILYGHIINLANKRYERKGKKKQVVRHNDHEV